MDIQAAISQVEEDLARFDGTRRAWAERIARNAIAAYEGRVERFGPHWDEERNMSVATAW